MKHLLIGFLTSCLLSTALMAEDGFTGPEKPVQARQKQISKIGILFSAVVPGAGQFYTKSWLKGTLFLGLEATMIVVSIKSTQKGAEIEDEFHDFADTHWSEERWDEGKNESDPSTHSLPATKTQQYYEMIGKYDQFAKGWDDWSSSGPDLTIHRNKYENMRHSSNIEFKRASYCTMGILANHLLSAFDTAFTIRKKNKLRAGLRLTMMPVRNDWVPGLNLGAAW